MRIGFFRFLHYGRNDSAAKIEIATPFSTVRNDGHGRVGFKKENAKKTLRHCEERSDVAISNVALLSFRHLR